ncbi:hypothetical protein LX32DRAFT_296025 [Colletotrichum zoysiae]|uniref:Uncharacterized protein n=1 Tax=Colletotrichum zoysiae TaxID=1216348 RepID=A0AAD9HL74_9PEZI|nr:hypothetical protein LX32DRAFT_296025 [Colletotrichum zoysiae]
MYSRYLLLRHKWHPPPLHLSCAMFHSNSSHSHSYPMTSCTPPDSTTIPRSPPSLCQRYSVLERACRPDALLSFCPADPASAAIHCRCTHCMRNKPLTL